MLFTILLLIMFAISIAYATFENVTEQTAQALIYQALVWTAAFGYCVNLAGSVIRYKLVAQKKWNFNVSPFFYSDHYLEVLPAIWVLKVVYIFAKGNQPIRWYRSKLHWPESKCKQPWGQKPDKVNLHRTRIITTKKRFKWWKSNWNEIFVPNASKQWLLT